MVPGPPLSKFLKNPKHVKNIVFFVFFFGFFRFWWFLAGGHQNGRFLANFWKIQNRKKKWVFFVFFVFFFFRFFSFFFVFFFDVFSIPKRIFIFFRRFFDSQTYFHFFFDCAIAVVTGTIAVVTAKLRSGFAGVVMEAVSARITVARLLGRW